MNNRSGLYVDDGRNTFEESADVHSDCDSEGNHPPLTGTFVDPASQEGVLVPPPRSLNTEIKLPFSSVRNRIRYRDQYASKIFYEEWVESVEDDGTGAASDAVPALSSLDPYRRALTGNQKGVRKLEQDSDYPVGKPYFWKAVCPPCNITYHPHIPPSWVCPVCKGKTWQQADDPESKACAVCKRKLAKMMSIAGRRIRSPISLNGHNCKRCGRVVCDDCYDPNAVAVPWLGFDPNHPVRVCTACKTDMIDEVKPPEEEPPADDDDATGDRGDEYMSYRPMEESQVVHSFWPPHCTSCNIFLGDPPPKWQCRVCNNPVWQPTDAPQSVECWICHAKFPKVRCHRCGQLVCDSCGAFGEPVSDRGYDLGVPLSVCRSCYGGISFAAGVLPDDVLNGLMAERDVHKRGAPQKSSGATRCALCSVPCSEGVRTTCSVCGWCCCLACSAYRQPGGGRGGSGGGQPVCRLCFNPRAAYSPDHMTYEYWPPKCLTCLREWVKPPERWRCPYGCGNVWQPLLHVASSACASCGKVTGGAGINCRCCGRVVCGTCGSKLAEVPERGFTRGAKVPRCPTCGGGSSDTTLQPNRDTSSATTMTRASPPRQASPTRTSAPNRSPQRGRGSPGARGYAAGRGGPQYGGPTQRGRGR